MGRSTAARALASLVRIGRTYGPGLGARKLALLAVLSRTRLASPGRVLRLHEMLCYLDAYPDDRRVHQRVRRMLRAFNSRPDLRRHRLALAGSGIAGTDTPYRFFWPTAEWITRNWPGALVLDRSDEEAVREILKVLPSLVGPARAEWLSGRRATDLSDFDRLVPAGMTDADFINSLIAAMPGNEFSREAFGDRLDLSYILRSRRGTPERTTARLNLDAIQYRRTALQRGYPDLRIESRRPVQGVRQLRGKAALAAVSLARISMVTRERDVAGFQFADPRDVFLVEDGAGLAFAMMGMTPARRAMLPATYTALILRNGVPTGYVQAELLGRHGALSFNTFEAFRGSETGWVFARFMAACRQLFGSSSFSIEPYQLGDGNDEGIDSGAWWFYYRLGFRPRHPGARRLASRELDRLAHRRGYRSPPRILRTLARHHLFFSLDAAESAALPRSPELLRSASRELRRFSQAQAQDRIAAATAAARDWLGVRKPRPATTRVLSDWSGIVLALARQGDWSRLDRRQLVGLIESKAGRSERDYLRRLMRHRRLRRTLDC